MPSTPSDVPATADLWDQFGERLDSCDVPFHLYGRRRRFGGRVVTFRAHEDNRGLKTLIDEPGEGRVVVVDGGGSTRVAMLGDNMAVRAAANGWSGVIIHGAVRDVEALAEVDLGVAAIGSNPRRSRKEIDGERDVPVSFGGARFEAGDWVAVDADGVVVHRGGAPSQS